jgi:hypothetical protein
MASIERIIYNKQGLTIIRENNICILPFGTKIKVYGNKLIEFDGYTYFCDIDALDISISLEEWRDLIIDKILNNV